MSYCSSHPGPKTPGLHMASWALERCWRSTEKFFSFLADIEELKLLSLWGKLKWFFHSRHQMLRQWKIWRLYNIKWEERLRGSSDITEVLNISNSAETPNGLARIHALQPPASLLRVYVLKGLMNHKHMITSWKKNVLCPVLFSIKKAPLGNADMWKQATKMQQISPCYPLIRAGKF